MLSGSSGLDIRWGVREKYWIVPHTTITTLALVVAQPPHNPAPVPVSRNMRISVSPVRMASTLLRAEASFCVAQRRRTEFLCSEKEGTARGTRGRFFQCVGMSDTTKCDQNIHTTHKRKERPSFT